MTPEIIENICDQRIAKHYCAYGHELAYRVWFGAYLKLNVGSPAANIINMIKDDLWYSVLDQANGIEHEYKQTR